MSVTKALLKTWKKLTSWLKKHRGTFIGVSVWAAIISIMLFTGSLKLSDRIQAVSILTLVFITWFYAVQTQDLVKEQRRALEEEKKKRDAEFGEKRITVFLGPLSAMLEEYNDALGLVHTDGVEFNREDFRADLNQLRSQLDRIEGLFRANMYMANDNYAGKLSNLIRDIRTTHWRISGWTDDERASWQEEKQKEIESICGMLEVEIHLVSRHIQDTYGEYGRKRIL